MSLAFEVPFDVECSFLCNNGVEIPVTHEIVQDELDMLHFRFRWINPGPTVTVTGARIQLGDITVHNGSFDNQQGPLVVTPTTQIYFDYRIHQDMLHLVKWNLPKFERKPVTIFEDPLP